jgi:hypothetical protein
MDPTSKFRLEDLRSPSPTPPPIPGLECTICASNDIPSSAAPHSFFGTPFDDDHPIPTKEEDLVVTIRDADILMGWSQRVLSDLSILHGEFNSSESRRFSQIMVEQSAYPDLSSLNKLCNDVFALKKRLQLRDAVANGSIPADQTPVHVPQFFAGLDVNSESFILGDLYSTCYQHRGAIEQFRIQLEATHKGPHGVYDYQRDVKYQVIGNQEYPIGYKRPLPASLPYTPARAAIAAMAATRMSVGGMRGVLKPDTGSPVQKRSSRDAGTMAADSALEAGTLKKRKRSSNGDMQEELKKMKRENDKLRMELAALKGGDVVDLTK